MFEVGPSELLVIFVLALLVLGPERLPRAARFAGLWVRKLRAQWYAVRADLERELADDEMRRHLQQPLADVKQALAEHADTLRRELDAPVITGSDAPPPVPTDEAPP